MTALSLPASRLRRLSADSLYRNGVALAVNSAVSSLLGSTYWFIATHRTDQATVGSATALVAAMMALSAISQLSLGGVLATYLPRAGASARALVLRSYALAVSLSLLLGGSFATVAPHISHAFLMLRGVQPAALFTVGVATWSVFGLQDNALTGMRRAVWVPVENTLYSGAKLAALVGLGAGVGALGVLGTWILPAALALLPVSALLFGRLLPAHATARTAAEDFAGLRNYFAGDTAGLVMSQVSATLLPVLVVVRLGPHEGGAFGIAWMLVQSLDLLAVNLGMSLMVEGAHDEERLPTLLRALRRRTLALVACLVLVGVIAAPVLLTVFGGAYAESATWVLRLLLLGSIGRATTVLSLCAARAQRRPRRILAIQASLALLVPAGAWFLSGAFGLVGVGIAWAAAQAIVGAAVLATDVMRSPRAARGGRTVLCVNHWHDDNKGDSAITAGIVGLVRAHWPDARVRVATLHEPMARESCGQTRHLERSHAVEPEGSFVPTELGSRRGREPRSIVALTRWMARLVPVIFEIISGRPRGITRERMAGVDLVVAVGGSNVYDNPAVRAPMSLARLIGVLYPMWAARRLSIPVVLAGHTLGPFPRRTGRWIARWMLRGVGSTSLREETSSEVAAALALKPARVRPDMAFAVEPDRSPAVAALLERLPAPAQRCACFVVRQHPHGGEGDDETLLEEFANVARGLIATGLVDGVVVVAHTQGPTPIEDDRDISRRLERRLRSLPATLIEDDLSPGELAALYERFALVVSVRLHAAILALAQGTPAYAIAYMTRKTEGVMASAGLPDAWCGWESLDADAIVSSATRLMSESVRNRLLHERRRWLDDLDVEAGRWLHLATSLSESTT